jgi:hypothetical protein
MSAAGAAASAAAVALAVKASGTIVSLEPAEFHKLLAQNAGGLVVRAPGGFLSSGHKYLTSYKGLAFYTSSKEPLSIPRTCDVVDAKKIWVPG